MNILHMRHGQSTKHLFAGLTILFGLVKMSAADYSGYLVSAQADSTIMIGEELTGSAIVQNTGSSTWNGITIPGWVCRIHNMSWPGPWSTVDYYVWHRVYGGGYDTFSFTMAPDILPSSEGTYSFYLAAYYPDDYSSGNYTIMENSSIRIEFTVLNAATAPEISQIICTNDVVYLNINNLTYDASNIIYRCHNLRSNDWASIAFFISKSAETNWHEVMNAERNTAFYRLESH